MYRILVQMFTVGLFDHPNFNSRASNVTSVQHNDLARKLSAASTVLLKNADAASAAGRKAPALPLQKQGQKIAFIGRASDNCFTHSGGSGSVEPSRIVTPLQGATHKLGSSSISYADGKDISAAVAAAKSADVAVVFAGTTSSEGSDRANLNLDDNLDALIAAVAAAQPNTVVVLSVPGAIIMPWSQVAWQLSCVCAAVDPHLFSQAVAAIVVNFMPGQEVRCTRSHTLASHQVTLKSGRQRHRRRPLRRRQPLRSPPHHQAHRRERPEVHALSVRLRRRSPTAPHQRATPLRRRAGGRVYLRPIRTPPTGQSRASFRRVCASQLLLSEGLFVGYRWFASAVVAFCFVLTRTLACTMPTT